MTSGRLPKLAVATLIVTLSIVLLSSQVGQVAAYPTPQGCYYYYGYWYYPYYYYYWYPYYYCYYGYYYVPYYDYYYYTPSKYQLTVTTDPPELGTATGSGTYTQGSTATFSVTRSVIQVAPNTRYVFSHWTGDYSGVGTSGTITINGVKKVTAVYQLQHQLDVGVSPQSVPQPQGEGWYNAGDTVSLTVPGQILGGQDGSRLVFQGWNIDGKTVEPSVSITLKMDSPHLVTAQFRQQYYLKVLTDQGVAFGEGWYDLGALAQIYASAPVSTSYGVSFVFNGWQGDIQAPSQSASVLMDRPKTVIASWRTDATILNLTIALGIIAAFLIGAAVLAYVAVGHRRSLGLKPVPKRYQPTAHAAEDVTPVKKTVPLKKTSIEEDEETG